MKTISSRHNPLVKRLRDAILDHAAEIALEGPKAVADAIAGGWKPLAIVTRGEDDFAARAGVPSGTLLAVLSPEVFEAVAETQTSQGVIGLFERPEADAAEILGNRRAVAVALDGIQDPGNVGTIIRLAAAFEATGVLLLPGCADPYGPKAIRASVGAVLSVPVAPVTLTELLESGLPLHAADASGERVAPPASGAVFVFGSEGTGISPEILHAARPLAIPMSPSVESLNVAAAAAILLAQSYAKRER